MATTAVKVQRSATEWAAVAELSAEARQVAAAAADARTLAEALTKDGRNEDAVKLLAHLLPAREGVLWAWSCAKRGAAEGAAPASLAATEQWIAQPTDEHRRAALEAAQEAQVGTAAGAAGLAAFLSGESLAPAGSPTVPPPEFLAAKAAAASITISALAGEPQGAPAKYREFLMRGFELAQRIQLWERLR